MSPARLTAYKDLTPDAKRQVKQMYVHRIYDPTSQTFQEWAEKHAFYTRKDGKLNARYNHAKPAYLADDPTPEA